VRDTDYTQIRMVLERRGFKNPGRELVRDALPQGSSRVQVDASSRQARITLAWRDPGALDSALGRGSAQPCPAELALGAKEAVLCYTLEVAW
jgi:hypothetical protein